MAPIVLLLGAGAALLLLKAVAGGGLGVGKTPPQERALLFEQDGWHFYQLDYQPMLAQRLKVMSLHESGGDPLLSVMLDAGEIVPADQSAFNGAQALHSIGYNIWVSPTLLSKTKQARWLYAAKDDEANDEGLVGHPPAAWKGKLALLALSSNPFPDVPGTPPPPPPAPPPPPPGA